jgi:hypothetical protein
MECSYDGETKEDRRDGKILAEVLGWDKKIILKRGLNIQNTNVR